MARSNFSSRSALCAIGVLSIALGACNSTPPAAESDPTAQPQASEPLQPKVEVGTVQGLQQGDRACMADVSDAAGNITQQFASVELCGQSELVGQSLRLYYEPVSIVAASCQGNPECAATETVLSIVRAESLTAEAAPAPAPQTPAVSQAPAAPAAQAPAAPPVSPEIPVASELPAEGIYMGVASTGEDVYYDGMNFQCGDLPVDDPCWSSPVVNYRIGGDSVFAQTDCLRQVFTEVWVAGDLVAENMAPQSAALAEIISTACYAANG